MPPPASLVPRINPTYVLAMVLLLLLINVGTSLSNVRRIRINEASVHQTLRVIEHMDRLQLAMADIQRGIRGYAITGVPEFLAPYESGRAAYGHHLSRVEGLTAENAFQRERVGQIRDAVARFNAFSATVLQARQQLGREPALDLIATGQGKQEMDQLTRLLGEIRAEEERLLAVRSDQTTRSFRVTYAALALANLLAALLVLAWFLAERRARRRLEERVRQRTAELQQATEALELFVYSMSHDLRTPVANITGLASILQKDFGTELSLHGREFAAGLERSARTLETLMDGLLQYASMAREDVQLTPTSIHPVLAEASRLAGIRELDIEGCRHAPTVVAHPQALSVAIANLLNNAAKFTVPGEEAVVRVRVEERGGRVRLSVVDEGIGISAEYLERIFQPLERLHGRGSYPGSGLGLAIVRRAVERMGGEVGVESELGKGSAFWIELQRAPDLS